MYHNLAMKKIEQNCDVFVSYKFVFATRVKSKQGRNSFIERDTTLGLLQAPDQVMLFKKTNKVRSVFELHSDVLMLNFQYGSSSAALAVGYSNLNMSNH